MNRRTIFHFILLLLVCGVFFYGCSKQEGPDTSGPVRDSTPRVLIPEAAGSVTYGTNIVTIDASHTDQGYMMLQYRGANPKVKLQMAAPDGATYTYLLSQSGQYETFPFSSGNGLYSLKVLENAEADMYSIAFAQDIEVAIADEFTPFLYPNQYVNFTSESQAVSKGAELASGAHSELEVIQNIYEFVTKNIVYDEEKALTVASGYLPVIDETLSTGKGICFDYASLMSAMLRSQGIPTRLEVGYAGEAHHAWISTYVKEKGWINKIIEFDGESWSLVDPTFGANSDSKSLKQYIGEGDNYTLKYSY